jgi:glycosyltransferase involved in cell wall biosynthesis
MKVSVIIPVKNRASLLVFTLRSVLQQSYKPYEVIVVDDSSTDNIDEVITAFKDQVTFIKSKGKGPGAARNSGLQIATGEAIQFFDSDDLMTRNKLQAQVELLIKTKADFVHGPFVKAQMTSFGEWKQLDVIMQYYPLPSDKLSNFVLEGWCPITQSALFTRKIVDAVGLWREDLMTHEDYEYWYRISKKVTRFAHENQSCVIYRQHENQITDKAIENEDRWLNGLNVVNFMLANVDKSDSLKSKWIFKGRHAASKIAYLKTFGTRAGIRVGYTDKMLALYNRIYNKIGRSRTGTDWVEMHGVLKDSERQFAEYISNVVS